MFVPSLSWRMFGFQYEMAQKRFFLTCDLNDDEQRAGCERDLRQRVDLRAANTANVLPNRDRAAARLKDVHPI